MLGRRLTSGPETASRRPGRPTLRRRRPSGGDRSPISVPWVGLSARPLVLVVAIVACSVIGCSKRPLPQEPNPTVTKTPKPTFTRVKLVKSTSTPIPPTASPTLRPTHTERPTDTPEPSLEPSATPTPEPSATPTEEPTAKPAEPTPVPVAKPAASSSSAGAMAAKPKGSSLVYEPEFPPVSPVSDPPTHGERTNPLSGRRVDDPAKIRRRPVLARYGNDRASRPHSGISQAEVVMEDLMDAWWITRITAVFLAEEPTQVGPLRSARPVNIEMLPAFDGVFVFSGASIGVTQLLAQHNYDLIHEGQEGDLFYRGKGRKAPHNLYASIPTVRKRLRLRGKERPTTLRGFTFSDEPPAGRPATRIDIPLPKTSTVAWTWDGDSGVYRRWVQGESYTDSLTGEQVGCENVIVIYAKHWESDIVEDSRGATAIGIAVRGGGRVQIFRDGRAIEGLWWRKDPNQLFQFIDDSGNHVPLKPGHSWIQFVPTTYKLGIS